ncbi:hypothetical protein JAAARDRAFT_237668 [Jaapia argillacea MUCL 33604]|uniref:Uncharacterized protein n=1 Tax=Jaapia argillacea MUCL 33604 TaxID=933084 RepID=A0A067QCR3_9AGAM|nr:hypothetical protein JAAARDRAFT_237668 [Jaapia argillacea MUCL 33604]
MSPSVADQMRSFVVLLFCRPCGSNEWRTSIARRDLHHIAGNVVLSNSLELPSVRGKWSMDTMTRGACTICN